jgi:hypothetical protein
MVLYALFRNNDGTPSLIGCSIAQCRMLRLAFCFRLLPLGEDLNDHDPQRNIPQLQQRETGANRGHEKDQNLMLPSARK